MSKTLAFDVYGTLIDTHGLLDRLQLLMGEKAMAFSQLWRDKQLEYSFRRGLMCEYQTFAVCTAQALDYSCAACGVELSGAQKADLLTAYRSLPAFADVPDALARLKDQGHALFAFSNGTADAVEGLLASAQIRELFDGVVSVDDKHTFKPNPDVYAYMLERTGGQVGSSWLISSNPFDVIGALSFGLNSAWVQRSSAQVFDPWGLEPTAVIAQLGELGSHL